MKPSKFNIASTFALVLSLAFTSCSKNDGAIPDRVGIEDVPAVSSNMEAGGTTATITFADQAAFSGKFKMSLYFADAKAPTKIEVVARKNATLSTVRVYKADITTLPASFTITAAEIATLFGAPLALNDTYDFAPNIYVGVNKYEAWPASGVTGSGQGITGMSAIGYGEYVRFSVK